MDREKIKKYKSVESFVQDKEFCNWVLHPEKELDLFWNSMMEEFPELRTKIFDAALIVRSMQPAYQDVDQQKLDEILKKILAIKKERKIRWYPILKYAAAVVILISIGSLAYYSANNGNQFPLEQTGESVAKGKVILADGSTKEFDTDQTTITQSLSGTLTINADTIDTVEEQTTSALNQIIIPYGKRSEITLADGTHIWLNSGSQLFYPTKFKGDSREVFLSGEALFDVKANPDKPFYVITKDIRIKVLGTSFNVSSYADDHTVQTVLLKGKVSAGKNKLFAATVDLNPGERLTYDKSNSSLSKDKVDVSQYSSWVNGYLIFRNVPINEVFTKLKRFYNQEIVIEARLDEITFSGKLDLTESLSEVLKNIAFASSLNFKENNGSFKIKK